MALNTGCHELTVANKIQNLSSRNCVCVCVCTCTCAHMYSCTCVFMLYVCVYGAIRGACLPVCTDLEARGQRWMSSSTTFYLNFLRQNLPVNLELVSLVRLAGWPVNTLDLPSAPTLVLGLQANATMPSFYVGPRDPNAGHHPCTAVVWLIDSSQSQQTAS